MRQGQCEGHQRGGKCPAVPSVRPHPRGPHTAHLPPAFPAPAGICSPQEVGGSSKDKAVPRTPRQWALRPSKRPPQERWGPSRASLASQLLWGHKHRDPPQPGAGSQQEQGTACPRSPASPGTLPATPRAGFSPALQPPPSPGSGLLPVPGEALLCPLQAEAPLPCARGPGEGGDNERVSPHCDIRPAAGTVTGVTRDLCTAGCGGN